MAAGWRAFALRSRPMANAPGGRKSSPPARVKPEPVVSTHIVGTIVLIFETLAPERLSVTFDPPPVVPWRVAAPADGTATARAAVAATAAVRRAVFRFMERSLLGRTSPVVRRSADPVAASRTTRVRRAVDMALQSALFWIVARFARGGAGGRTSYRGARGRRTPSRAMPAAATSPSAGTARRAPAGDSASSNSGTGSP